MKVLVVGSLGSMGKRYCAILKYLDIDYVGIDLEEDTKEAFTHAIICTPTDTHIKWVWHCVEVYQIKNILCEKPISKNPEEIKKLAKLKDCGANIRMVCNWKYCLPKDVDIAYSNYNTGKDGTDWDCIQLIYLAKILTIDNTLPYFECRYKKDGLWNNILSLSDIEQSYLTMIQNWLELDGKKNDLWGMQNALEATESVIKWEKDNE